MGWLGLAPTGNNTTFTAHGVMGLKDNGLAQLAAQDRPLADVPLGPITQSASIALEPRCPFRL